MDTIPELKNITAEIRVARQRHKIKSSRLARESGISPSAMSKLEKDRLNPSYGLVYEVLKALDRLTAEQGPSVKVSEKMIRNVMSVSPVDAISKARKIMKEKSLSQLPVIDRNGRIVGIITEKGILDHPDAATCEEATESAYAIVEPDTDFEKARQLARNTQAILVAKEGKLIGILTKADFI